MIDDAHPSHLGTDRFEGAAANAVSVRNGFKSCQKLPLRPFEFYEDCEERLLMEPIAGEQRFG